MKPEFGVVLPNGLGYTSQQSITEVAREAESLGYDFVSSTDWVCHAGTAFRAVKAEEDIYHYDTIAMYSYLAGMTKKLKFRFWAMVPPPRNPLSLAKQLASLDNLSNGRITVSFGIGSNETFLPYAEKCYHVPFKTRVKVIEEYAQALREIWSKGRASFKGRYIDFEDAVIFPKPVQKPLPIYMAARSKAALDRVARLGDGWSCNAETPSWMKEHYSILKEKVRGYGKKENMPVMHGVRAWVANTHQEAIDHCKEFIEIYPKSHAPTYGRPAASVLDNALIGTPSDAIKKIQEYMDAGVTAFLLVFVYGYGKSTYKDIPSNMKVFRDKVISSFK
ncbi:MAG: LLM class flavin-dependent oxidoreductase [Thaumarchaeota archaeon]|nr:LLM class flavin-dependent oxidoreductase [Nitrososphaerota archaeon]